MQLHIRRECVLVVTDSCEVKQMSEHELHAPLADLCAELRRLSVTVLALRDRYGRDCLEVHNQHGPALRIHVSPQCHWFVWGPNVEERHSLFNPTESAHLIVAAIAENRPVPQDLRFTLDAFFR